MGGAYVSSNGSQIDTFSDGSLHRTPNLDGVFTDLGATVFIGRNWGVGAELAWTPTQGNYAGLQYRPSFYNFDGIFRPERGISKRLAPEFRAGIGGARIRYNSRRPNRFAIRFQDARIPLIFQVHAGVAARWYWTNHIFSCGPLSMFTTFATFSNSAATGCRVIR